MNSRSIGARLMAALLLASLAAAAIAAPASAVVRTRYVDNDNSAGDGPARCDNAGFSSIQAAINASSAGDRVYVCPGSYTEQLTINKRGLEVRSVPALAAKLNAPATLDEVDGTTDLVRITARNVKFVGFKVNIQAGEAVRSLVPACEPLDAAIYVNAANSSISGNHIRALGDATLSGDCGYLYGIVYDDGDGDEFGQQLAISNRIVDFKLGGILVGPGSHAQVFRNALRYVHMADPETCVTVPVLGVQAELTFPCFLTLNLKPTVLNGFFTEGAGILVEAGKLDARGNTIYSTFDWGMFLESTALGAGIVLLDAEDGSIVRNNTMNNVGYGMIVMEGAIFASLPTAEGGLTATGNRINESYIGMMIGGSDGVYYGNRAHLNIAGAWVVGGGANTFIANDFRYNVEGDCIDETSGPGTLGTANNWDAVNYGVYNSPSDLCFELTPF